MPTPRPLRIHDARRRLRWEIWIVLGLSLLPSAAYALLSLLETLAGPTPIAETTQAINPAVSAFPLFDVLNRLVVFLARLMPVALVIWLLWSHRESGFRRLGFDLRSPGRDLGRGLLLAAAIGIPGLALYAVSRLAGATAQVVTADSELAWWTAMLYVLAALRAALIEEVIVVGYLVTRLRQLGWGWWPIILTSALVRGSYHLYQGVPMALGNVAMGILFAAFFIWWSRPKASGEDARPARRRVMPLVIAHFLLDLVAFLGYPLAVVLWPGIF